MDGPGESRRQYNLKRLALTDIVLDVERGVRKTTLMSAWQKLNVTEKFNSSAWGRKLAARAKKANLTDYERHQILMKRVKVRLPRPPRPRARRGASSGSIMRNCRP